MTKYNSPTQLSERDAKAGRRVKGMTIVLALSTVAALIVMMVVFTGFAV